MMMAAGDGTEQCIIANVERCPACKGNHTGVVFTTAPLTVAAHSDIRFYTVCSLTLRPLWAKEVTAYSTVKVTLLPRG